METKRKPIIELKDVKRDFVVGDEVVHALRGVSFSIYEGEFVTIMGTSGSGKSTLLNIIGGLDTATSGKVTVDGKIISNMDEDSLTSFRQNVLGLVFQFHYLLKDFTAL